MNEFVGDLKLINFKNGKLKIFKFSNPMIIKKISYSRSNLFSRTPKKQSKRIIKQNQLNDYKVKILEN